MISKNITYEPFVIILYIFVVLFTFFERHLFDFFSSISMYMTLAICLIVFLKTRIKDMQLIINCLFILFFSLYSFGTLFLTNGGIGSILTAITGLIVLLIIQDFHFSKTNFKLMLIFFGIINFLWIFYSKDYYINQMLDFNAVVNSNTIAVMIMYVTIYISIFLDILNKKSFIIELLFFVGGLITILNCQARGALLTLVAYIILRSFVRCNRVWHHPKVLVIVGCVLIVGGLLFPYLYVGIYKAGINFKLPLVNKSFYTGREEIWFNFYALMGNNFSNWVFGIGSKSNLWQGHDLNLHNNYLALITNFGIIGFVLYFYFLMSFIYKSCKRKVLYTYQRKCIIAFYCVLLLGYLEISTLWSVMCFFNFLSLGILSNDYLYNNYIRK